MRELRRFVEIVKQLRSEHGCPWDKAQTHLSLRRCLVEECGEFLDALEEDDVAGMREELGDLLLQVVLHAQIAAEADNFDLEDVAGDACKKLLRRHPHVFAQEKADSPEQALLNWEKRKLEEPDKKKQRSSAMDGVPRSMPALARAQKTLGKAVKNGFQWQKQEQILDKIDEELGELKLALQKNQGAAVQEELGDLLFSLVSLSAWQGFEAEEAMQAAVAKFMRRFRNMEKSLKDTNQRLIDCRPDELLKLWQEQKNS